MTTPTFDPAEAFVGAVLHSDPTGALELLDVLCDGDLVDPRLQVITNLALQLAENGIAPDPVAVLNAARTNGVVTSVDSIKAMATQLHELYVACLTPTSGRYYALLALGDSLRARCTVLAGRVAQAAEGDSLESLIRLVDRETQAVHALVNRRTKELGRVDRRHLAAVPTPKEMP